MDREPDATMQPTLQDNQLMSKHRVLGLEPQLRLEWRGQDGQNETKQPDHSASLGDFITSSTRIRFSVRTPVADRVRRDIRINGKRRIEGVGPDGGFEQRFDKPRLANTGQANQNARHDQVRAARRVSC